MPKFFVNSEQIQNNEIEILGTDINHIKNVLRKKVNDEIIICDTNSSENYFCKINSIEDEKIKCIIERKLPKDSENNLKVTIYQGLPKADKMELIIQKSVELGVNDITPIIMNRCIVKLNEKDKIKKIERWRKISEVAAKQAGRNIIPEINNIISIKDFASLTTNYDVVLIAYENEKENTLKNEIKKIKEMNKENLKIAILIGPEGGIEEKEIDLLKNQNVKIVSLGNRILRTETVALNVLSILMYELEM